MSRARAGFEAFVGSDFIVGLGFFEWSLVVRIGHTTPGSAWVHFLFPLRLKLERAGVLHESLDDLIGSHRLLPVRSGQIEQAVGSEVTDSVIEGLGVNLGSVLLREVD
jgi:uncharacterized protein YidB (DUF937 family)